MGLFLVRPRHEVQQRLLLLHQTETDLRRALAAHRYVVRHMVAEQPPNPPNPAAHAKRRETSASESEGDSEEDLASVCLLFSFYWFPKGHLKRRVVCVCV